MAWYRTKDGRNVLMNTTGSRYQAAYLRGPHAATCPGGTYAEDMAKAAAAIEAYRCPNCQWVNGASYTGTCEVCHYQREDQ